MKEYLVYLAGPISGRDYAGATGWREAVRRRIYPSIKTVSPMRGKANLERKGVIRGTYEEHPVTSARGITARDRFDVQRCDAVLVNLLGATEVSRGSTWELAWADAWGKLTVVVMEPKGNPNDHPFLRQRADFIVSDLDTAIEVLEATLLPQEPETWRRGRATELVDTFDTSDGFTAGCVQGHDDEVVRKDGNVTYSMCRRCGRRKVARLNGPENEYITFDIHWLDSGQWTRPFWSPKDKEA